MIVPHKMIHLWIFLVVGTVAALRFLLDFFQRMTDAAVNPPLGSCIHTDSRILRYAKICWVARMLSLILVWLAIMLCDHDDSSLRFFSRLVEVANVVCFSCGTMALKIMLLDHKECPVFGYHCVAM
jgi:hypothetical protein